MRSSTDKRSYPYPYSKNRVYASFAIFLTSLVLAVLLLWGNLNLMLYYIASTIMMTIATFLVKTRLYVSMTRESSEEDPRQNKEDKTGWKMLIIALLMLIGAVAIPMVLAGLLSGESWFILMISFTSGVSISEIILYLQT